MTSIFRDTGLGYLLGVHSREQKPDLKSSPSWWLSSPNHELSLKLESVRIPATCRYAHRERPPFEGGVPITGSPSLTSLRSDDTEANEKKCAAADRALGWDGPDDPGNPLNFSPAKKALIEILINVLTVCVYLGTSIFSPGIPSMVAELQTSQTLATLGTSVSLLGYAIGPMVWSPLSECPSIGRNPVYMATLAVFILVQLPIAMATNIETVLIFRFLSGVFGSPAQATGGATLSDIYLPRRRSYAVGLWELSSWVAPTLGPLIGGVAAQNWGWRWTTWELMTLNGVIFLFIFCLLPETSPSNILYRRAKRLRSTVGTLSLKPGAKQEAPREPISTIMHRMMVRPFMLCFGEPICLLLNTYTALITGLFFATFETFPIIFVDVYKLDLVHLGLVFLGLLVGAVTSFLIFLLWFRCCESKKFDRSSQRKPEERFIPLMAGCSFLPLSLFIVGWTVRKDVVEAVPIVGSGFYSLGSFSLFISILNYLPDAYPEYAASVLAGNNFLRSTAAAACALFAGPMYKSLGPAYASTILGCLGCAFVPVPFLFYFYGDRIRARSRYALKDL